MSGSFEAALEVYYGTYIEPEKANLVSTTNPESILIWKDLVEKMSRETRELLFLVNNLPEEMFLQNGKVAKLKLLEVLQIRGWTKKQMNKSFKELKQLWR